MLTPIEASHIADTNEIKELLDYIKDVAECGGHSINVVNIGASARK